LRFFGIAAGAVGAACPVYADDDAFGEFLSSVPDGRVSSLDSEAVPSAVADACSLTPDSGVVGEVATEKPKQAGETLRYLGSTASGG